MVFAVKNNCCYALQALCNTVLLRQYGKVDKRVPELVFAIKLMVKISKISGAFQGFLSSYALVLMVIHFLQQTTPPVVPCLQQVAWWFAYFEAGVAAF